jgi:hypothetical protein
MEETKTEKLSYYQKNKEKILEKRKLKRQFEREERLRLGRPFMKFDDDADITFEPSMNEVVCLKGDIEIVENVVEPLEPIVENVIIKPIISEPVKPIGEPVVEKKKVKKSKKESKK